jgi:diguanylate cyclase (GGDEF)-like protein
MSSGAPIPNKLTVLVVDDQRAVRMVAAAELDAAGYHVLEADSAAMALDLFTRERPDLVLLDVEMPQHDGYAVARQMRLAEPDGWTPIVFLSSHSDDAALAKGIEAGGDDYLTKPLRPVVLRAKLLAMRRLQDMRRRLVLVSSELSMANESLRTLSLVDALTGLLNRRAYDERLRSEVDAARREHAPLTLIMCDVDHFKLFNDHSGHQEGDACLQRVAKLLRSVCRRPRDAAARYGGEEFALILPGTPKSGALIFGRAIVKAFEAAAFAHPTSRVAPHVTVSGGIFTLEPGFPAETQPEDLTARADAALYLAKQRGRNRFHSANLEVDTGAPAPN